MSNENQELNCTPINPIEVLSRSNNPLHQLITGYLMVKYYEEIKNEPSAYKKKKQEEDRRGLVAKIAEDQAMELVNLDALQGFPFSRNNRAQNLAVFLSSQAAGKCTDFNGEDRAKSKKDFIDVAASLVDDVLENVGAYLMSENLLFGRYRDSQDVYFLPTIERESGLVRLDLGDGIFEGESRKDDLEAIRGLLLGTSDIVTTDSGMETVFFNRLVNGLVRMPEMLCRLEDMAVFTNDQVMKALKIAALKFGTHIDINYDLFEEVKFAVIALAAPNDLLSVQYPRQSFQGDSVTKGWGVLSWDTVSKFIDDRWRGYFPLFPQGFQSRTQVIYKAMGLFERVAESLDAKKAGSIWTNFVVSPEGAKNLQGRLREIDARLRDLGNEQGRLKEEKRVIKEQLGLLD